MTSPNEDRQAVLDELAAWDAFAGGPSDAELIEMEDRGVSPALLAEMSFAPSDVPPSVAPPVGVRALRVEEVGAQPPAQAAPRLRENSMGSSNADRRQAALDEQAEWDAFARGPSDAELIEIAYRGMTPEILAERGIGPPEIHVVVVTRTAQRRGVQPPAQAAPRLRQNVIREVRGGAEGGDRQDGPRGRRDLISGVAPPPALPAMAPHFRVRALRAQGMGAQPPAQAAPRLRQNVTREGRGEAQAGGGQAIAIGRRDLISGLRAVEAGLAGFGDAIDSLLRNVTEGIRERQVAAGVINPDEPVPDEIQGRQVDEGAGTEE